MPAGDRMAPAFDELLRTARKGDQVALGRLLDRYRAYLTLVARPQIGLRLQSKVDVDDLVQDTFLDAHRQFPRFQGDAEAGFLCWLRSILAGQLAHLIRRYCGTQNRDVHLEQ